MYVYVIHTYILWLKFSVHKLWTLWEVILVINLRTECNLSVTLLDQTFLMLLLKQRYPDLIYIYMYTL